jgi:DNA end-binding protein Ku
MKLIKAKAAGKKTAPHPLKVVHSTKMDLMDQLKESLSNKKKKAS